MPRETDMKTKVGEVAITVAPLDAGATREQALAQFDASGLSALPVAHGGRVVGVLLQRSVQKAESFVSLLELAEPLKATLDAEMDLPKAARSMVSSGSDCALVVRDGEYVGVVTAMEFLGQLGRSWDPLTGLHFSDVLREWGDQRLSQGQELCVVFVDLNDFGKYNKKYGHVVGDRVLVGVGALLRRFIESDKDVLVRFGGDEFAIATTRTKEEAAVLVDALNNKPVRIDGVPEDVSFSVGLFGGRRQGQRDGIHGASNIDDLINGASRATQAAKMAFKARQTGVETLHGALGHALEDDPRVAAQDAYLDLGPDGLPRVRVIAAGKACPPEPVDLNDPDGLVRAIARGLTKLA